MKDCYLVPCTFLVCAVAAAAQDTMHGTDTAETLQHSSDDQHKHARTHKQSPCKGVIQWVRIYIYVATYYVYVKRFHSF